MTRDSFLFYAAVPEHFSKDDINLTVLFCILGFIHTLLNVLWAALEMLRYVFMILSI